MITILRFGASEHIKKKKNVIKHEAKFLICLTISYKP